MPYKNLLPYLLLNKYLFFYFDNYFWGEKFKSEFSFGLDYPKYLENLSNKEKKSLLGFTVELIEKKILGNEFIYEIEEEKEYLKWTWRKKILLFLNFREILLRDLSIFGRYYRVVSYFEKNIKNYEYIFDKGNELLLISYLISINRDYGRYRVQPLIFSNYFKKNFIVNDKFVLAIIEYTDYFKHFKNFVYFFEKDNYFDKKKFLESILLYLYITAEGLLEFKNYFYIKRVYFEDKSRMFSIFEKLYNTNKTFKQIFEDKEILLKLLINGIVLPRNAYNNVLNDSKWIKKAKKIDNQIEYIINYYELKKKIYNQIIYPEELTYFYLKFNAIQNIYKGLNTNLKQSYSFNLFLTRILPKIYKIFELEIQKNLYIKILANVRKYISVEPGLTVWAKDYKKIRKELKKKFITQTSFL